MGWESPLCTWHIPVLLRSKSMFGGQTLSCKGHFFDDPSLLFSTVPKGMLFKKTPCLIKKLTLFAIKSGLQTYSKKAVCPFLSRKKGRKNAGSSTGGAFTLGITGSEALAPALDVRDCPFSGAVPVSVFKRNHGPSLSVPVAIAFACCPLLGGNRQGTFFALNCRKWPFCPGLLPNAFI